MSDDEDDPMMKFVKALARRQAQIDWMAGIRPKAFDDYAKDPSPENKEAVLDHMHLALELLFKFPPK